jgi:hypothetical protein
VRWVRWLRAGRARSIRRPDSQQHRCHITSLDVSYTGEQWRNGGNATAHSLTFQYQIASPGVVTSANVPATGWTTHAPLSFTGPIAAAASATLDGNLGLNRTAISATLTVTVNPGQEIWLRWQDPDDAGNDHGLAIDDFSVVAHGVAGDNAPTVTGTTPANTATNVPVASIISIAFSESVTATASAFSIQCPLGVPQSFTQSASPAGSFTLAPASPLPANTTCTVTVTASQITDADLGDPPDQMAADFTFSFTTASPAPPVATNVVINEVDSDTPDADVAEFVELYDGGVGNTSLTGLVLVFFNGTMTSRMRRSIWTASRPTPRATSRSATRACQGSFSHSAATCCRTARTPSRSSPATRQTSRTAP